MAEVRPQRRFCVPPLAANVWLFYLCSIPLSLVLDRAHATRVAIELGGIVAFLVLYVVIFQLDEWVVLVPIAAVFALGAGLSRIDPASGVYFIFGASFVGWSFDDAPRSQRALCVYLVAIALAGFALRLQFAEMVWALVFSAVIGFTCVTGAAERRTARRLSLAYDEVERLSKIAERERIARDLHDVLGHSLSVVVLKSELASRVIDGDPARAAAEMRDVERIARSALADVREALAGYRGGGIAAELERARDVFASAGIALDCDASDLRLPAQQEGVLALAIREAVTNVVRHAGARTVRLVVRAENGGARFEIVDDGATAGGPDGAGLRGMRERVEALGGVLERESGNGTRLVVSLPRTAT